MQYSINDFIDAVHREQQKRLVTYPKMLDKCEDMLDTHHLRQAQEEQNSRLETARTILNYLNGIVYIPLSYDNTYLNVGNEILREFNCRMRFYPLMIMRHRITKEKAKEELGIWKALLEFWFESTEQELKFLKTKAKLISNELITKV